MQSGECFHNIAANGLGIGEGRALKNVSSNIAQKLIEVQMLIYFRQPCFCQYLVPVAQLKGSEKLIYKKNLVKYF